MTDFDVLKCCHLRSDKVVRCEIFAYNFDKISQIEV